MTITEEALSERGGTTWASKTMEFVEVLAEKSFETSAAKWLTKRGSSRGAQKKNTQKREIVTISTELSESPARWHRRTRWQSETDCPRHEKGWELIGPVIGEMIAGHKVCSLKTVTEVHGSRRYRKSLREWAKEPGSQGQLKMPKKSQDVKTKKTMKELDKEPWRKKSYRNTRYMYSKEVVGSRAATNVWRKTIMTSHIVMVHYQMKQRENVSLSRKYRCIFSNVDSRLETYWPLQFWYAWWETELSGSIGIPLTGFPREVDAETNLWRFIYCQAETTPEYHMTDQVELYVSKTQRVQTRVGNNV